MQDPLTPFAPWESFYVIVGSSGAALTGLQFVVMALVADSRRKGAAESVAAFGTPTIVHFCVVLLTAGVITAPWQSVSAPAMVLGLCGLAGVTYAGIVTARARRHTGYKPVLEDWIWHSILPFVAYTLMVLGAIGIARHAGGLFAIGATSMLLLFIGIHNAWDTVTFVATAQSQNVAGESQSQR